MTREYYRHLPHQIPEDTPIFVTWNLKGVLPKTVVNRLRSQRHFLAREPRRPNETAKQHALRVWKTAFGQSDEFLDKCDTGPLFLGEPSACANS